MADTYTRPDPDTSLIVTVRVASVLLTALAGLLVYVAATHG